MHQISADWWHESHSHKSRRGRTFWRWLLRDPCCSCRVPQSAGVDLCLAVCLQVEDFIIMVLPTHPVLQALQVISQSLGLYLTKGKIELSDRSICVFPTFVCVWRVISDKLFSSLVILRMVMWLTCEKGYSWDVLRRLYILFYQCW